jgi:hypothetical protein
MYMETIDLQYRFFVVDERPFCLWDTDISRRTLQFLDSIDPSYYEYLADAHGQALSGENDQHAALAIRAAYSQALETLFALLCATVQAPVCPHAWMIKYRNRDLYSVVEKIHDRRPILSLVKEDRLSWQIVSDIVHVSLVLDDKEKERVIKQRFGQMWSRFASRFLDKGLNAEYNSIKHGLRVRPGGFQLAIGLEEEPGSPAPKERRHLLGKSDYGSSFFIAEAFESSRDHLRLVNSRLNWDPEDLAWGLHLISTSISNIISALRILNGSPAEEAQFIWPTNVNSFEQPWKRSRSLGVASVTGPEISIPQEFVEFFDKETILSRYQQGNVSGIRRIGLQD